MQTALPLLFANFIYALPFVIGLSYERIKVIGFFWFD